MSGFAQVEGYFPDSITCVCGDTCVDEGMIQCDSNGIAFHLSTGAVPAGLVEMPGDTDLLYMVCPSCGRNYHDKTITETGTAPVFKTSITGT